MIDVILDDARANPAFAIFMTAVVTAALIGICVLIGAHVIARQRRKHRARTHSVPRRTQHPTLEDED